jgi:hypothetical protein
MTGTWSGAYRYPGDVLPETVFEAVIEERDGAFTGSTTEPNILRPWLGGVVTADIDGHREGQTVRFTKFMDGSGEMDHAVLYEGQADADLTRIEGGWRIPGEWSGGFFMVREGGEAEKVALEHAAKVDR